MTDTELQKTLAELIKMGLIEEEVDLEGTRRYGLSQL